jgi:hypothetical protein
MAAGSEILFTATSYGDPGLDITQFGDKVTITGVASISVYDGTTKPCGKPVRCSDRSSN